MKKETKANLEKITNQLESIAAQITCITAGLNTSAAPTPEILETALGGIELQITEIAGQLNALQKEEATA